MFKTNERITSPKRYQLGSRKASPPQYLSINHSTSHRVRNGGILFLFRNVTCPIVQSSIWSSPSMHRCYEEHLNDLPATLLWRNALGDQAWVALLEIQSPFSDLPRTPDQNTYIWQLARALPDSSTFCSFNLFTERFTPNSVFKPHLIYTPHIPVWLVLNPQTDFSVYNFAHKNPSTNYVPFFLSHLNDDHTHIYTDGSKTANKAGCGLYLETLNILCSTQLKKFSSVFSTELYGMLQALCWISTNHIQKAVIITDSFSALRAIQHPNWKRHQTVNKIVLLNHTLITSGNTITFLWTLVLI